MDLAHEIRTFVAGSNANLFPDSISTYFDTPLVGFAAADDPLFRSYKEAVGPFHLTPADILPGAATVIVWVLPIAEAVRASNRREQTYPSREWAWTRSRGEALNVLLRKHVVSLLEGSGVQAVAPQLSPHWRGGEDGVSSTWSERHAAHAAGLGTFSLNDALITEAGIAHRCGSVITDLVIPPTPRPYADHREYCLYFNSGTCGACIRRCPVAALGPDGHNKHICKEYVYGGVPAAVSADYGVTETGCGLCQTAVPCEAKIPRRP